MTDIAVARTIAEVLGITSPGDVGLIVACFAGLYASAAWSKRIPGRKEMFRLYAACMIMGMSFTVVVNAIIAFTFEGFTLTQGVRAALGAIVTCVTRFWLPNLLDAIKAGKWVEWIPFLNRNRNQDSDPDHDNNRENY